MISEENYRTYLHNYYQRKTDMAITAHVRNEGFFPCCGVRVLGHATFDDDGISALLADDARKSDALARALMDTIRPGDFGCYLYTTISRQKVEYNALKMAGFKVIGKFKNPRSGNWVMIHAWTKEPLPSRTKTVRGPRSIGRAVTTRPAKATAKRRLVRR